MTDLNGSIHPIASGAQPAPAYGSHVEINPKRLGIEGNQILGQVQALSRWAAMFAGYAQKTLDLRERATLVEVSKALSEQAEVLKVQLAQIAIKRGAGSVTNPTDDTDET